MCIIPHTYMHALMCVHAQTYTHTHTHTQICTRMHLHTLVHTQARTHMYTHIHAYTQQTYKTNTHNQQRHSLRSRHIIFSYKRTENNVAISDINNLIWQVFGFIHCDKSRDDLKKESSKHPNKTHNKKIIIKASCVLHGSISYNCKY